MTSTKERIKADIKQNVETRIRDLVEEEGAIMSELETDILDYAGILAGKLTNLASAGSKAGEAEIAIAVELIEQKIAKALWVELKKKYNLK